MMIKQMKCGIWTLLLACVITLMPIQLLTVFGASARIAFSDPSASVGSQVSVNMKITSSDSLNSADVMLAYDANALEFVSGTNAEGGNGAVRVHGDAGTPGTGSLAFTLTFNAITAGTSKITITSEEVLDGNDQIVTVDQKGDSTVTISALATASKDATLKSLQVSPGTLTPEFSAETDTYAVTVGTDVEKLIISADCTDENATMVINGNENLQMGENRVSCKVVAQDGETSMEYVIVVTKAEGGASAASGQSGEQYKMRVLERTITILEPDDTVAIPEGFAERSLNIDGHEVRGWVWGSDPNPEYCVVYGMNEAGDKSFYRYDMGENEHTIQRYFEDPAIAGSVSGEEYNQLALKCDQLEESYNLFRILLIAAIVIALVLLVLLIASILGKGDKKDAAKKGAVSRKRGQKEAVSQQEEEAFAKQEAGEERESYEEDFNGEEFYEEPYDLEDVEDEESQEEFYEEESYEDEDTPYEEEWEEDAPAYEEPEPAKPSVREPQPPVQSRKQVSEPSRTAAQKTRVSDTTASEHTSRPKAQTEDEDDFEIFDL